MVKPFVFEVGKRTVNLNASGVNQLLNAASAKEAYSTRGGGLWGKFCDFFCIGNDRNAIKALFYAIVTAPEDASPQAQLLRFQKLASCANTNYVGLFHIQAKANPSSALLWKYSFLIDNTAVYHSCWHQGDSGDPKRKDFCSKMTLFNIQQDLTRFNKDTHHTRENYSVYELETLSDNINNCSDQDGTSRHYLREHLYDPFFCSANFKEIRNHNGDLLFDAVFSNGDEERVLRLCNRSPNNGEFRGITVQNAFVNQSYTDLYDFITAAYGTENDSELRYIMRTHFISLNNMIQTHIDDADVVEILSAQVVARMGCPPVAVAKLINR